MRKPKIPDKLKNIILATIFKYIAEDDCIVFIFGSYATGDIKTYSDIDIGIISKNTISDATFAKIRLAVQDIRTLREIQVINFNKVSKEFRDIAIKGAKIWHKGRSWQKLNS
jgi:predicted nucleotidyltransferase